MRRFVVSSVALLLVAATAWAGSLAPKKPSETVVLTSSPFGGPCVVEQIGTQIAPDGTEIAFQLEVGEALMVTDINWMLEDATAGDTVGLEFYGGNADTAIMVVDAEANARGVARGQTHLSTPVRVNTTLCANPVVMDGTTIPNLHDIRVMGFITGDR